MNLYLVSQNENTDYDTYDSFICCAEDEYQARNMQPDEPIYFFTDRINDNTYPKYEDWCKPEFVTVTLIGTYEGEDKEPTVILTSFNAG